MKFFDESQQGQIRGRRLEDGDVFNFRCHAALACFNQCCRNLNLFLYPFDVLRLSRHLEMSTDAFIEQHVDVVLREGQFFPEVLLRMAENEQRDCPFLTPGGCRVYSDRPDTCRAFPVERGAQFGGRGQRPQAVHFFRPPEFCLGPGEDRALTPETWSRDQEAEAYYDMTLRWAEIRHLLQNDPWGAEGPGGAKAKMAFMATYNLDRFKAFIFDSSFFKRYKIKSGLKRRLRSNDKALLQFGFDWVKFFVLGIPSKKFRLR